MNRTKRLTAVAVLVTLTLAASSCGDFFVSPNATNTVDVGPSPLLMKAEDTQQMTATATLVSSSTSDVTSTATWSTGSSTIATVDAAGKLTAGAGTIPFSTTTVSAKSGGVTGTANILVTTSVLPTAMSISGSSLSSTGGATVKFLAQVTINGTLQTLPDSFVKWSIDSTTFATISSTGVVTPVTVCLTGCPTVTATINTTGSVPTLTATKTISYQ